MKALSTEEQEQRILAMLRALGNPARYRIARMLADRASCVCGELVDALPLAQSTVSEHLKVLKEAGIVQGTIEGVNTCYCLAPEALRLLADELRALADAARTCSKGTAGDTCAEACAGGECC
jgi:DNA-binding transcriptional ArsR family regulator